jgi:hypothetical protein
LKEKGIILRAMPLGKSPKKSFLSQVRPEKKSSIKSKFGQAKTSYGLDQIKEGSQKLPNLV